MGGKGDRCGGQEGETISEKEMCVWCSALGGRGGERDGLGTSN